jgi:hypothetical protein
MQIVLQRYSDNRDSTLGLLFEKKNNALIFQSYTLEDEFRETKVSKETRIPVGFYELKLNKADTPLTLRYRARYPSWFTYHIEITGVPNFKGVYIHVGNTDEDTEGCILVGDNADNNQLGHGTVSNSVQAFTRLYKRIADVLESGQKAFIEIRDEKSLL